MLNIQTPIVEDFPTDKTSSARIIELCLHYNCDTYLSGPSGKNYLDMSMFKDNNVEVIFQRQMRNDKRHTLDVLWGGDPGVSSTTGEASADRTSSRSNKCSTSLSKPRA